MHPLQTLELICANELSCGKLLEKALELPRHYGNSDFPLIREPLAVYLPAINATARIHWATTWVCEFYKYFDLNDDDEGPNIPLFLVTIADKTYLTNAETQNIDFESIRRKLSGALQGLDYVGMIEPGFYNVIYDEDGEIQRDVVSWHGHFLVWNTTRQELQCWRRRIKSRIGRVVPHRCAVHIKRITTDQFGHPSLVRQQRSL